MVAFDATATADRAWASDRDGDLALRGSGAALNLVTARQVRHDWFAHLELSASTIGNLTRTAEDGLRTLADAQLIRGSLGAGATLRWFDSWWFSATLGLGIAAYTSPRVLGTSGIGLAGNISAARSFGLGRTWSIDVASRATSWVVPDGRQTWTFASIGVGVAVRAAW
jgi:hypothetical protein